MVDPKIRALAQRKDRPGVIRMAVHLGTLVATGGLIQTATDPVATGLAMLIHGIVLTFLFAPLHEAIHRTAFRTRSLNLIAAELGGLVMVLPPRYFRAFHFAHHRHTQDPERDPELLAPKPKTRREYFWVLSGFDYWIRSIRGLILHALGQAGEAFIAPGFRHRVIAEARAYSLIYSALALLSVATESDAILRFWIVPALLGQPFLRAYLLVEHWGRPTVPDMWLNSRTTASNRLVRLLAWNMPYHAEHHAHPGVPFHALPALHELAPPDRGPINPGYLGFHMREAPRLILTRKGV